MKNTLLIAMIVGVCGLAACSKEPVQETQAPATVSAPAASAPAPEPAASEAPASEAPATPAPAPAPEASAPTTNAPTAVVTPAEQPAGTPAVAEKPTE